MNNEKMQTKEKQVPFQESSILCIFNDERSFKGMQQQTKVRNYVGFIPDSASTTQCLVQSKLFFNEILTSKTLGAGFK